jgi:hypothetical protein
MQAEARIFINGKDYGTISADRAADRFREIPDSHAEFSCPRCSMPYVAVAIYPRKTPYQVSPHFRLRDGDTHKAFCPNRALNQNAKEIHVATGRRVDLEILSKVPQILDLPDLLDVRNSDGAPLSLTTSAVTPKTSASAGQSPRQGRVRSNSVKGIVQFRNATLRQIGEYKKAAEILREIPLQLPGPPPYWLDYERAFRRLTQPCAHYRIVYGNVLVQSIDTHVRLVSQEVVADANHPYPGAVGKPALIELPPIDRCGNSDDIAFLARHKNHGKPFKIYCYSIPALICGSLVYHSPHWQVVDFRSLYNFKQKPEAK